MICGFSENFGKISRKISAVDLSLEQQYFIIIKSDCFFIGRIFARSSEMTDALRPQACNFIKKETPPQLLT